ncbi:IclR family transcriptional regulator [Chelativorans sp.]|uniref:IclR family transcriptional regulator n=1 Tax=Chelativorans sp. TaxID=2203393 RepID=UPI002810BEE3|nr:IclR family transcriptional regulator [Chelativorans sp.]
MAAKKDRATQEWKQRRIQSIEVGFQVIRALEAADGPLPLREIAAAAGMPPSKVHLYLVSFVSEGVAYQDPTTGHYGLGRFAIQLGLSAIRQLDVVELAREELSALRDATGFATYLSLWGDRGPGIVSKMDGERQGSLAVRLGYVLPLLASATGQVFLAFLEESETRGVIEDELASAVRTSEEQRAAGGNPAAVRGADLGGLVESIRAQGYAMTTNSINSNFAAVAAPVFDYSGRIAAAMTVLGSDKQLTGARRKATIAALLDAARRLSEKLGASERRRQEAAQAAAPRPRVRRKIPGEAPA